MAKKELTESQKALKASLEKAGEDRGVTADSQSAHKLAVFRFIADALGASGETRQKAWKAFESTPGSFGTNSSALRQALWQDSKATSVESEVEA